MADIGTVSSLRQLKVRVETLISSQCIMILVFEPLFTFVCSALGA